MGTITQLLARWGEGDVEALDRLVAALDHDLRRISSRLLRRERPGHTLGQTTALVNETYVCLLARQGIDWKDRGHFIGIAARIMRQVLVDYARRHQALKRGGGSDRRLALSNHAPAPKHESKLEAIDLVALHRALERLAVLDERQARIVELRFFGGLSIQETAALLRVSSDTVKRDWRNARLWLRRELASAAR